MEQKAFWLDHPEEGWLNTEIPADEDVCCPEGGYRVHKETLPSSLVHDILRLSGKSELNIYLVLLAGMAILLRKYLSEDKLQIGTPVFSKQADRIYVNHTIPLRLTIAGTAGTRELLLSLKEEIGHILRHQNDPAGECGMGLFLVFENLQEIAFAYMVRPAMIFSFLQNDGSIEFTIHYSGQKYNSGKIRRLCSDYQLLLAAALGQPDIPVRLLGWPDARLAAPAGKWHRQYASVIAAFEEQAGRYPDGTALTSGDMSLTYGELDRRASLLAEQITAGTRGEKGITGILLERSFEMIVGILGILKAGCAYLPLDPGYPEERIHYILDDSGCTLVITDDRNLGKLSGAIDIVNIDHPAMVPADVKRAGNTEAGDPLYIIYTSGTTGRPKGVVIENGNLSALFYSAGFPFRFDHRDTWLLFHSYCFDFSVWEIFGALLFGGRLVILPDVDAKDPDILLRVLMEREVTVLNQTPSAFYNLLLAVQRSWPVLPSLRYVVFGGEALSPGKLAKWFAHYPEVKLINMYGITETTIHVTFKEIGLEEIERNQSNIGVALPHLSAYIVNKDGDRLPPRIPGEIIVEGGGVARGYLNRPELTAEKFFHYPQRRGYRSGDLGYVNGKGEIIYLGRRDSQVQLRGYRIELGEIESALLKVPGIENVLVVLKENGEEDKYLCAYYVARDRMETGALYGALDVMLPRHMIPSFFVFLEKLPLNRNGKIDMGQLPPPASSAGSSGVLSYDPRGEVMAAIWKKSLGLNEVSAEEGFFSAGGDSMKAIRLLHQINEAFEVRLTLKDIYKYDSILKMLGRLDLLRKQDETEGLNAIGLELAALKARVLEREHRPDEIEDVYPATDLQKGLVLYSQAETHFPMYHDMMVHRMHYPDFDFEVFSKAVRFMGERHAILRACFNMADYGEAVIMIHGSCKEDIGLVDLLDRSKEEQEEIVRGHIEREKVHPFRVNEAPLWRIRVFRLSKDNIIFLSVCHHAIMDGWSDAVFKTELHNVYTSFRSGKSPGLSRLRCSFRDFVLTELLCRKTCPVSDYWRKELSGYSRLVLSTVSANTSDKAPQSYRANLSQELLPAIDALCAGRNVSRKTLLFTAYVLTLKAVCYQSDFVVGYTSHNRPVGEDGDKLLGCFLSVLPVNIRFIEGESWLSLLNRVEEKTRVLKEYDHTSLAAIMDATGEGRVSGNPFFDTLFNFVDFHIYGEMAAEGRREDLSIPEGYTHTNTLLDFNISKTLNTFELVINYEGTYISRQTIGQLAVCYQQAIRNLLIAEDRVIPSWRSQPERLDLGTRFRHYERSGGTTGTEHIYFEMGKELSTALMMLALDEGMTLPGLLFTLFGVLLYKYTLESALLAGLVIDGRSKESQDMVDALLPVLPVRLAIDPREDIPTHYSRYATWSAGTYEKTEIQLHELADILLQQPVIPDSGFVDAICAIRPDLSAEAEPHGKGGNAAVAMDLFLKDGMLCGVFKYRETMSDTVMKGMPVHFKEIISQVTGNRHISVDELQLSERRSKPVFSNDLIMTGFDFRL